MAKKIQAEFVVKDKGSKTVKTATKKIEKSLDDVKRKTSGLTSSFKSMLGPLAAMAIATKAAFYIKGIIDYGDQLGKTSKRLGVAVDELDKLVKLGKYADITFQELNTAFRIMAKNLGMASTGIGEAARALDELGINSDELFRLDPMGRFKLMAEAISNVADASKKAEYAQMIWGRSGTQLLTMVDDLTENMEALNSEWDNTKTKQMEDFNDAITQAGIAFGDLATKLVNQLLPPLTKFFGLMEADYIKRHTRLMIDYQNKLGDVKDGIADVNRALEERIDIDEADEARREHLEKMLVGLLEEKESLESLIFTEKRLIGVRSEAEKKREQLQEKIKKANSDIAKETEKAAKKAENAWIKSYDALRKLTLSDYEYKKSTIDKELADNLQLYEDKELAYALHKERMRLLDDKDYIAETWRTKKEFGVGGVPRSQISEGAPLGGFGRMFPGEEIEQIDDLWKSTNQQSDHMVNNVNSINTGFDTFIGHLILTSEQMKEIHPEMEKWATTMESLGDQIQTNIVANLTDALTGAKTFGEAMKDMLGDISQMLMKIVLQELMIKAIKGAGGGGTGLGGLFSSFVTGKDGGIAPGGFQAFAAGGIANKPTLGLIGEGGQNEAVVPLPDGKSIPIEGGGGDTYTFYVHAIDSKSLVDTLRRNPESVIIPITEQVNRGNSGLRNSLKRAVS